MLHTSHRDALARGFIGVKACVDDVRHILDRLAPT